MELTVDATHIEVPTRVSGVDAVIGDAVVVIDAATPTSR